MEYEYVKLQKDKYGSLPANGSLEQLWRSFVWLVNIKTSKLLFYTLTALEKKTQQKVNAKSSKCLPQCQLGWTRTMNALSLDENADRKLKNK